LTILVSASARSDRDFAERTFRQLEGFGSYGFPESEIVHVVARDLFDLSAELASIGARE